MPEERLRDVLHALSPFYRILVFLFGLIPTYVVGIMFDGFGGSVAILGFSLFMVWVADRRPVGSFGLRLDWLAIRDFAIGILISAAQLGLIFAFLYKMKWIHFHQFSWDPRLLRGAMHQWFGSVLTEELILRGYVFQCLLILGGRRFGPMLALGLTSSMFGLYFYEGVGIRTWNWILLGAGFGVAYLVTRRLWLPIAMHFAWCLIHDPILGFRDSYEGVKSLVSIEKVGPEFWTGGWPGLEGSPIMLVASLLNIALLLYLSRLGFWRPDPYPGDFAPRKSVEFIEDPLLS